MYVIKQKKHFTEDVAFENNEGKRIDLHVDLDLDAAAQRYWKQYETLAITKERLAADPSNAEKQELFGRAVMSLMAFIFGEDQARQALDFYKGRESELFVDVLPFLCDVVFPKLREASKERVKAVSARRSAVRSWRR